MKYYMAPMEGITGFVFRNAYDAFFEPMDKYFTPFISPTINGCFTPKERRDILPENNKVKELVPQILCNKSELFLPTAHELSEYGYKEVNLNFGCPSGTVVSKKKGAGFLSEPYRLECFLDEIFQKAETEISIKTRLGMREVAEFDELLAIFSKFPIKELILHARVREEYYKGTPHRDKFYEVLSGTKLKLCYNGDVFTAEDIKLYEQEYKKYCKTEHEPAVMLGRGVLRNPYLVAQGKACLAKENAQEKACEKKNARKKECEVHKNPKTILAFSERLFSDYAAYMGEKNAMFRMKELWFYLAELSEKKEQVLKGIKKAENIGALHAFVDFL